MSEKNDFSFMKTGFNLADNSNIENEQNIISLVTLFAKNALETASKYVTHAERKEVTVTDIKKSLMLEVFLFMKRPNVVQKTDELKQELFNNTENEIFDEEIIIPEEVENEVFKISMCTCKMCVYLNTIEEKWENWTPTSPFETLLKKHIDEIPC